MPFIHCLNSSPGIGGVSPAHFSVLRNLVTAGIFICRKNGDELIVDMEFVVAEYRDFKLEDISTPIVAIFLKILAINSIEL